MVICKFFLQGTCKFGSNCRFDHQMNDHNYGASSSILLQNYSSKPAAGTSTPDTNSLVKAVVNDMTSAEKGGQWLLSSYAPFKEKPPFPGFEDHSMEEIRYQFYESMRNGTIEQFKQNLQMMLQQAIIKIKALQNPSPDAVNMLKVIYNTAPASSLTNNQTPFNASGNSMFGNTQLQPQPQTIFAGSNTHSQSIFSGSNPTPNIFAGGNTINNPSQSMFAGSNSNFGTVPNNNGIFGPQPSSPSKQIFGPAITVPVPVPQSLFTGNSIFSGATPQINQAQNLPLPTPMQNQMFQQNPGGQFTNLQTSQSQFGPLPSTAGPQQNAVFQHSANIFGNLGMQAVGANAFGQPTPQPKPNEDFYSKAEELTEEEMKWFQSDDLDINSMPEKPPTYEMCFKL